MKRTLVLCAAALILVFSLTACGSSKSTDKDTDKSTESEVSETAEDTQVIHGTINKIDSYLVLLTDDGEYQIMDYGEEIDMDAFSEGDSVNVTYTGTLGDEEHSPVITAIEKAESSVSSD